MKKFATQVTLFFILTLSNYSYTQFPVDDTIIHPFLSFDRIGNCFTIGSSGELYFGMTSNKIYKISDYTSSTEFDSITMRDIPDGVKFKTGCIHKNGDYFILGNTYGPQLIIRNIYGVKIKDFDLSSDDIACLINYVITSNDSYTTTYYFGTSDNNSNCGNIVKLVFNKSNPCSSSVQNITISDITITHTPSLAKINNILFISTNSGKILRYDLSSSTFKDPIEYADFDFYIRHIITDGIRLFAIFENSDFTSTFWRINDPTATNPSDFTIGPIGNSLQPYEQPYGRRMYYKYPNIYITYNGWKYNISSGNWTQDTATQFGSGYEFLGGYKYESTHYLLAFDNYHFNSFSDPEKRLNRRVIGSSSNYIREFNDITLTDEGSMLQTIETKNNILLTGTYWPGYLHSYNVYSGYKELFPHRHQADVIKKVSISGNHYILYGCYAGMSRAQLLVLPPTSDMYNAGALPSTFLQECSRIISICADDQYVYFGTGEQSSKDGAKDAEIAWDSLSNIAVTPPEEYDFTGSVQKLGLTTSQKNSLGNPIRIIALAKYGDYLYGITGNTEQSDGDRFFIESYFFRLNVSNHISPSGLQKRLIPDKIRRDFASKTLKIFNNRYLYVGAGTQIWKYDLDNFYLNSPVTHNVGNISSWQEDHILAIEHFNNKFYILFANKVKVYDQYFHQLGSFRAEDLNLFKDMVINEDDGYLYVVTSKGFLYKYDPDEYMEYTKAIFAVSGDFDQDGRIDDVAELCNYEETIYGNGLKINVKSSDNSKFVDRGNWLTKSYFNPFKVKHVVVGDYDSDGYQDDIATFYDNGNGITAIHVFKSNGSSFTYFPNKWGPSSSCDPAKIKFAVSGDFDGTQNNIVKDIAIIYDNGNNTTSIRVFNWNGSNFSYLGDKWGPKSWFNPALLRKAVIGDFDQDNTINDIAVLYDNNNQSTAIHVFNWNGSSFGYAPNRWGPMTYFNANLVRHAVSGDFDHDGRINDIAVYYDYMGSTGIHMFNSYNTSSYFEYHPWWWGDAPMSPKTYYNSNNVRFACVGDFKYNNKFDDIVNYYDGSDQTAMHLFIADQPNAKFICKTYWYKFIGLAKESNSLEEQSPVKIPDKFNLTQNFPNPFNLSTIIKYDLARSSQISIVIYNILGQKIKTLVNQHQEANSYKITWNGKDDFGRTVQSGVYFLHLFTENYSNSIKLVLLK